MADCTFSIPSEEEYNHLRELVGWEKMSHAQFENSMANSVNVTARDGETCVGFARMITDHGLLSLIVDVMVDPAFQRQGIGAQMVRMLMLEHKSWLAPGEIAYIHILATTGNEPFYKKLGFTLRPNLLLGAGMTAKVRADRKKSL